MNASLVIKTGAAGDVVRTTSLLNILEGEIYWVTDEAHKPLLPDNLSGLRILSVEEAYSQLPEKAFEQVISLEEDKDCARLASSLKTKTLVGVFLNDGEMDYTETSASWFDMSRISKFGMNKANRLKAANPHCYQHFLFQMLGKPFEGQPYRIFDPAVSVAGHVIGIEKRSGKQWPNKQWWGYDELERKLVSGGMNVVSFQDRINLRDYLRDIAACSHIVCGDTLAMHVALAYSKTCTAVFNCTSPQEIFDYGLLQKLVSPLLSQNYYHTTLNADVIRSVSLPSVYETIPGISGKE